MSPLSPLLTVRRKEQRYLPSKIAVVGVADKETFGGECVGLNLDVGAGYLVDEGRFADVGKSGDQNRPGVRVDRRKTRQMLSYLDDTL